MSKNNSNYKTPQRKIEDLLNEIENDLNLNNNKEVACEQLFQIGKQQQDLLQSVSDLYQRYLNLSRRC